MRLREWCVLVSSVALIAVAPVASASQQRFRADVNTVAVYATVTNADGALVPGLDQSAFVIEDNGRRRPITLFKGDVQPITIAILLDRSPSLFASGARAQDAVIDLVRRLLPIDRATVGSFSHVVTLNPELTSDAKALVLRLADPAPFPAGTALWDAIEAGRAAVSAEPDRRVVLVITDAADNASTADIDEVRRQIERDDVMLYGVGVRGREGLPTSEMRAITRATGGHYFELKPEDDLGVTMQRIADELHQQYVIGFAPAELDGRVHRLTVRSTRPGLTVRARRSYIASPRPHVR